MRFGSIEAFGFPGDIFMTVHCRLILVVLLVVPAFAWADTADQRADDVAIREVFAGLTEAWKAGDGRAWSSPFLPDADFTTWFGLLLQGQETIAQGHQFIFDHFYANTRYELTVKTIRFVAPSAAVVHLEGTVVAPGDAIPAEPDSVPLAVVQKVAGQWKIAAFHNTPFALEKYGRNGDLRQFKGRVLPTETR